MRKSVFAYAKTKTLISCAVNTADLRLCFRNIDSTISLLLGERVGLVVNASDSGSRGRGFEPHSGQTVLCP